MENETDKAAPQDNPPDERKIGHNAEEWMNKPSLEDDRKERSNGTRK